MGKITGFLEYERNDRDYEPVEERVKHWREFVLPLPEEENKIQAARCMDCGIPYCHGTNIVTGAPTGCPVNNLIPDWNDLVYRGDWEEAARNLHSTNNFPEVTGRVCPAPCEASCTLNIDDNPVTIKTIECAIADRAIAQGLKPEPPAEKTGKKVAVVGSGPAGMACAQQLARAGHDVHLFEKCAKAGGLMRYGIPDFKMEKHHVDKRVVQMEAGRRHLPLQRPCRRERAGGEACRRLRRGRARGRRRERRATCRSPAASCRHPLRHGFPAAAEPARLRRAADAGRRAHSRHRQARRRHRRRRHRLRLHRHLVPAGRAVGDQFRDHAAAAGEGEQAPDLARLAVEAAHLVEPRGGRRARFRGRHARVRGRRTATSRSCNAHASTASSSRSRAPSSTSRPISCCWRWASCRPCTRA